MDSPSRGGGGGRNQEDIHGVSHIQNPTGPAHRQLARLNHSLIDRLGVMGNP